MTSHSAFAIDFRSVSRATVSFFSMRLKITWQINLPFTVYLSSLKHYIKVTLNFDFEIRSVPVL